MLFSELLLLLSIEPVSDPRSAFPCSGGESQVLARLKHYFWDTVCTTAINNIINTDQNEEHKDESFPERVVIGNWKLCNCASKKCMKGFELSLYIAV